MAGETHKLQLTGQAAQFAAVKAQLGKWRDLLAERKAVYDRISTEAQAAWRENPADPVLSETWAWLKELAEWFGVEVRE